MVNPFDHDFFKFLFGFVAILSISLALLYVVGQLSEVQTSQASATTQK